MAEHGLLHQRVRWRQGVGVASRVVDACLRQLCLYDGDDRTTRGARLAECRTLGWCCLLGSGRGSLILACALVSPDRWATARRCTRTAFTVSLALWGVFLLADEIFIAYSIEGTHLRIFAAQLVTLLVMELVPERRNESRCAIGPSTTGTLEL